MGTQYKPRKKDAYNQIKMMKMPFLSLLALALAVPAFAAEIYHWVDENGVANFSSTAPPVQDVPVKTMVLDDSPAPRYDPEKDPFDVEGQAERMAAYREQLAKRREAANQRRASQPRTVVQYQDRYVGAARLARVQAARCRSPDRAAGTR